jgi:group II intron reverse transcriptase/maturase
MHQKPGKPGPVVTRSGEAARRSAGDEAPLGRHEPRRSGSALLEAALVRENLMAAWKRVKANRGSAGVDGRSIEETGAYLKQHWLRIRAELLRGTYRPCPVRRVAIPKPDGGERELGIPTVLDRLIQQALLQVLQPLIDPTFSDHSYGFRPGRSAHMAICRAQGYIAAGKRYVVDVDLEKFFDRVQHDVLMDRLGKRIDDPAVVKLIRRYLQSGVMANGVVVERYQGTPQGGPLSPLLANVLLDEVDRELERRGHAFVRYADDCNVYVGSRRAGERVMAGLRKLYGGLKLAINEGKSAVAEATERSFLGFGFYRHKGEVKRRVADKALRKYQRRIRQLTRRNRGRSIDEVVEQLRGYVPGWKAYFRLAQTPSQFRALDEWLRHRLRALHLKHWKRGTTTYRCLLNLGASPTAAALVAAHTRRWWHTSRYWLNHALPIRYFDRLGVPRLA